MPAGVYIHIPFCKSRCSYCDFATDVYRNDEAVERYVAALLKETEVRSQESGERIQNSEVRSQESEVEIRESGIRKEKAPKGRQEISPGQAEGAARGGDAEPDPSRVAATPYSGQEPEPGHPEAQGKSKNEKNGPSNRSGRSSLVIHNSSLSSPDSSLSSPDSSLATHHSSLSSDTIYFGGGTPSLLSPRQMERILEAVRERFEIDDDAEITVEMNPATVTLDQLKEFKALGVNRASFGVQTFNERSLKLLARGHDADDARKTYDLLRKAGFGNVSFDLIAGLPHQTLDDWKANLDEAVAMSPDHISLYLLEIHEATPLAEQVRSGRQPLPDEELAAEMYEMMLERLEAAGYRQYEISNFAREGLESRHNLKYWELDPVIGLGVSAHSFDGTRRWVNVRDTLAYVKTIECGDSPVVEIDRLPEDQLKAEFAFLKLRLNKGLSLSEYKKRFGTDMLEEFGRELSEFREIGLIEIGDDVIRLTDRGRLYSNEVFGVFV